MDISKLTPEEKTALFAQLESEQKSEKERIVQERETFKTLKDETIREMFEELKKISKQLYFVKGVVFSRFDTIREMKNDLFKTKSDRKTDTYTTGDGRISITVGNRVNEGWDDTVEVGIEKVRNFIKTLAKDENSANLVETIMSLIAKDRKGNLKASKVLELEKLAKKCNDAGFNDGIAIIKDAYRPAPSRQFIEAKFRDDNDREHNLPLSISAFDL
ncbi:MAG: DUF3164 family protein [Candidatus Symbiothrix sp.]|jgi:hypothetical protein|nr:DUF3164 family protein [Candidatus Symbiothrix sp.]